MKKYSLFLIATFLIISISSIQPVIGQEKTQSEQEREAEIQKAIDQQKKAMAEQKKAMEEKSKAMEDQKKAIDEKVKAGTITEIEGVKELQELDELMKDVQVQVESAGRNGNSIRIMTPRGSRSFNYDEPFVYQAAPGMENFYGHSFGGDAERTTWDFTKTVKETTFSGDYTFEVEKTVKNVVMSVNGDCKAGEIRIKILMPNGKSYSDIVIDEFGNLNWRKSFKISDTENQDKTGNWKFQISSTKASGYFKISLQTY
jgi:hypothetical protein